MKKLSIFIFALCMITVSQAGTEVSGNCDLSILDKVESKCKSITELVYHAVIVERISSKGTDGIKQGREQVVDFVIRENSGSKYVSAKVSKPRAATVTYDESNSPKVNIKPLLGYVSPCHGMLHGDGHTSIIYAGMNNLVNSLTKLLAARGNDAGLQCSILSENDASITLELIDGNFNPSARTYTIKSTDKSIADICIRENVPIQTTLENNDLARKKQCDIEAGQTLKIANGPFKKAVVVLSKSKLLPTSITVYDNHALPLAVYKHEFK